MAEQQQDGTASVLERLWEEHIRHEFSTRNTDETLKTMVEDAYVNHVPVLTGGYGQAELRDFYSTHLIPEDAARYGNDPRFPDNRHRSVDEMVVKFTHSIE